jgi:ectoine hydroxylase-related dioxygenase (phytanoyl-CoA dioxygenase family)
MFVEKFMTDSGQESKGLWNASSVNSDSVRVGPGVTEVYSSKSQIELHAEEISRNGYTVLEDCFTSEDLELARKKIDHYYKLQVEEIGGEDKLKSIGDELSVKHLIAYDDVFRRIATHEKQIDLIRFFLGDYFILNLQNGVINKSEYYHPARDFHRDLFFAHYSSSRPLAISALCCIDEFSTETGGTFVLTGSHKFDSFPSPAFAKKHEEQLSARAGSVIVFDSMMYHRTGENTSGETRRAISQIFTVPMLKQQIDLPNVLKGKYSDDPFLAKLLGYESETAKNVTQWRRDRIERRGSNSKRGRQI